ncbi:MAG: hypothetical protein L7G93_06250 [Acidilobus sp.]|nr:hypothetical protein [Acidilobus sp.]
MSLAHRPQLSAVWALFIFTFLIYVLLLQHATSSGPDGLLMAIQYSLLRHHTMALGNPSLIQVVTDQLLVASDRGAQYYSAGSYGLAILALPVAALALPPGSHFNTLGPMSYADRLFIAFISATFVAVLYKELRSLGFGQRESIFSSLTLAFTTTLWPESEIFLYAPLSALALTLYIAETYKALLRRGSWLRAALSGVLLGVAAWSDYSIIAAMIALALALVILVIFARGFDRLSAFITAVVPLDVAAALQMATSYAAFGDPFFVPGLAKGGFTLGTLMLAHALYNLVSPYRGVLIYDGVPLLALAYAIARRRRPLLSALLLSAFLAQLFEVSAWVYWDGGLSYGPRLLLPALGPLFLLMPYLYRAARDSATVRAILTFFLMLGFVINEIGAVSLAIPPAAPGNWLGFASPWQAYQVYYDLELIASGRIINWITMSFSFPNVSGTVAIMIIATLLPALAIYLYGPWSTAALRRLLRAAARRLS